MKKVIPLTVMGSLALTTACSSSAASGGAKGAPSDAPTYSVTAKYDAKANGMLPPQIRGAKVIRAVTASNFPPFASKTDNEPLKGLDVDLANALGVVLGVKVELSPVASVASYIPGMQSHRWDTAISPMADTTLRQQQVDFVDYYSGGSTLIFTKANPDKVNSLSGTCGKSVAVAQGSSQVGLLDTQNKKCLAGGRPAIKVVTLPDNPACVLAVRSQKASAAFLGEEPIAVYLKESADLKRDPTSYSASLSGIAVLKGNDQLRDAMKTALQDLMDSGLYQQIIRGWGLPNGTIKQAVINKGTV